jgi:putative ABC transport system permease protein
MDRLRQDLRFALRSMARRPLVTAVALATLAVAVGANTAIFTAVRAVLLRPLPYQDPARLVWVWDTSPQRDIVRTSTSAPAWAAYRDESGAFERLGGSHDWLANLTGAGEPESVIGYRFSEDFFSILGVPPLLGRTFTAQEMKPGHDRVLVISHALWQRRFGGERSVLGRSVLLDGDAYTVIGVMPRGFAHPPRSEMWAPMVLTAETAANPRLRFVRMVGRLKPGVSLKQARAMTAEVARRLEARYPDVRKDLTAGVEPIESRYTGDIRPALLVLLGAVAFVLLIACANVSNILLARATDRQREIAIRASLGASRRRLVAQMLTESVTLALLGGALGVLLAVWGVDALLGLFPTSIANVAIPRMDEIHVDGPVLAFALGLSVFTGLLFGLFPALQTARAALSETLREGGRGGSEGRRSRRFRSVLVVSEFALALVLTVGAALMMRSFLRLRGGDLGFDPRGVTTARIMLPQYRYPTPESKRAFYETVLERVRALPGVEAVGETTMIPLSGWNVDRAVDVEGRPAPSPDQRPMAEVRCVNQDFFQALRIPLRQGRVFTGGDREGATDVVVVNETFARRVFPGEDPLGRRIAMAIGRVRPEDAARGPRWREIVGVVGDVRHFGLAEPVEPEMYVPYRQEPVDLLSLLVRTRPGMTVGESLRQAVWTVDRDQPVLAVLPLEQMAAESVTLRRVSTILLGGLAGIALFLAALGIYGVMAHTVAQRTHEIGVRMAVGARARDVVGMVLREGGRMAALGAGLGLLAALALTRLLESLLFGVSPTDPLSFATVIAFLFACALLGCWLPARRAARVDPIVALRYE